MLNDMRVRYSRKDHSNVNTIASRNLQSCNDLVGWNEVWCHNPNFSFSLIDTGKNSFHAIGPRRIRATGNQGSGGITDVVKRIPEIRLFKRKFFLRRKMPAQQKLKLQKVNQRTFHFHVCIAPV